MRRALLAGVLAGVTACATACGGGAATEVGPAPPAPVALALGESHERYTLRVGDAQAIGELEVKPAGGDGGDYLVTLTLSEIVDATGGGPLAGLDGVSFRWRMNARGAITAAAGPSGPPGFPADRLAAAVGLWPLIDASVPRLPAGSVGEGATWSLDSRTEVVGGGRERVVDIHGDWRLAKIFALPPPTVVIEGVLAIEVRDPAHAGELPEKLRARVAVYLNLERHAVDFVTVSSDTLAWQARRL